MGIVDSRDSAQVTAVRVHKVDAHRGVPREGDSAAVRRPYGWTVSDSPRGEAAQPAPASIEKIAHGPRATLLQRSKAIDLPLGDQAGLALVALWVS